MGGGFILRLAVAWGINALALWVANALWASVEIHGAAAESSTLARHGADLRQQWVTGQRSLAVIQAENRRLETAYDRLGPATRRAQQQLVAAIHRTRRMRASVGQGAVRVRYLRRRASGTGG